ncbi:MAG: nuclear transport factor 2 family protein [Microlunatus sp.]
MDSRAEVLAAARMRAEALGRGDRDSLEALLHPQFAWTSHKGTTFDKTTYLDANTAGPTEWHGQRLEDVHIRVIDDVAVLRCVVSDDVTTASGRETFRMPMTQTWIRGDRGWQCLAGHAGPRLN